MALLGPSPSPAGVASLVRNAKDDELFEIFEEVLQFTDGPILTHLAANKLTRSKLVDFLNPEKLRESLLILTDVSDPDYVALSILADEVEKLRKPILDLVGEEPMSPSSLTIFTRLLAKSKLDLACLSDRKIDQILEWTKMAAEQPDTDDSPDNDGNKTESYEKREHWSILATLMAKTLCSTHKDHIMEFARTNMGSDSGYAVVRAVVDEMPDLADIVWQSTPLLPLSRDYLHMLSVLANSGKNREKFKQDKRLFSLVSEAADKGSVIAAVVEAKVLAGMTSQTDDIAAAAKRLDTLSEKLFEKEVDEVSLEGLACSAMLVSVCDRISHQKSATSGKAPGASASNPTVITGLVTLMKRKVETTSYAVLAVLTQLAKYPIKPTKDEEHQNKLRIQALGKSVFDYEAQEELDNENKIFHAKQLSGRICDQILVSSAISWLSSNVTRLSSAAHVQLALFLREMASHQEGQRRHKQALQGSAVLAMFLWSTDRPAKLDETSKSVAASVVSKILATVPPELALTEKVSTLVVVAPLVDQIFNESSQRRNLDTFEALRALTNISSVDNEKLRTAISLRVWPRIVDALNSEFLQISRSALELVCNLMMVPESAQHFLQRTPASNDLLSFLGRTILSEDEYSRWAASGALAILAEWETAAETIGMNRDCISAISKSLGLFMEDDALLLRVLSALKTILQVTTAEMNDEVVERIVFFEGVTHLEQLVDTIDPVAHGEVARRTLQCIKLIAEYKVKNT